MMLLKDIKVIELASVLAGPAVGMFFAELGATVIKIENKKTGGDVTRTWRLPAENKELGVSAYYASVNWQKKVMMLDLTMESERNKLYEELLDADVVIANYRATAAQKMGVDYESLRKIKPNLIYGNITGFGEDSNRVAFDVVLQAESGFMYMNGQPESPPTKMPVALIDILAAHQLKEGLLLALWQREKTGEGAYVSVSLLEAALSSLANQATNWLMAGHIASRIGSKHPNIAPYGEIFTTADGKQLVLAIGNDKQFTQLCELLAVPNLAEDARFQHNVDRVENRQILEQELQGAIEKLEAAYMLKEALARSIPIGQIRNMQEVFEMPEAEDMVLEEEVDGQLTKRVRTIGFQIS
jgi:crotonobetainyl-CoA:carnitine CoA-transferase CaiB-like acyl-CoA transferase